MSDVSCDEPPEDVRPWEELGAVRRDALPHRGEWLYPLARTAAAASFISALSGAALTGRSIGWGFLFFFVFSTVYGLACGGAVFLAARHDLAEMRVRRMHTGGWSETELARTFALGSMIACAGVLAAGLMLWALGRL
ncbi:MAG TPA: hypothetical protein VJ739_17585 [Gemmataceae bacterium]|nr:hypothetical protein [Gemmataceae bacterium]